MVASLPGGVSSAECTVMPLNSFVISGRPLMSGARVALGSGVGVAVAVACVDAKCSRSNEIQL